MRQEDYSEVPVLRIESGVYKDLLRIAAVPPESGGFLYGFRREEDDHTCMLCLLGVILPPIYATGTFHIVDSRHLMPIRSIIREAGMDDLLQEIVWLHTHPGLRAFLSEEDKRTLRISPINFAVVADGVSGDVKGFYRRSTDIYTRIPIISMDLIKVLSGKHLGAMNKLIVNLALFTLSNKSFKLLLPEISSRHAVAFMKEIKLVKEYLEGLRKLRGSALDAGRERPRSGRGLRWAYRSQLGVR